MDLTAWIDVAIGLSLVYLGASLFVTIVNELLAQWFNFRGRDLRAALSVLIADEGLRATLRSSPALKPLFDDNAERPPSYVDPNVVARMLVGSLAQGGKEGQILHQVRDSISRIGDDSLRVQLLAVARTAEATIDDLVHDVGDWLDRSLSMLGEAYKRRMRMYGFVAGLLISVGFNINTISLTHHLYTDKLARDAAVNLALQLTKTTTPAQFDECLKMTSRQRERAVECASLVGLVEAVQGRNADLGMLPIGWDAWRAELDRSERAGDSRLWLLATQLVGWLLTALAVSLGAPFWFDLLNKLVNVRHGMRRPEVKPTGRG